MDGRAPAARLVIRRPELAQPVLERLVAALAARVDLPLDRLSDGQIASAALVATASRNIPGGELRMELDGEPGAVIVRLGPLPDGAAARVVEDTAVPGVGQERDRGHRTEPQEGALPQAPLAVTRDGPRPRR